MNTHHIIGRIERASHRWNWAVMVLVSPFILGMMILGVADASGRYLFNNPIMGAIEIEAIMLAYIGFMTLAYGLVRGSHVRVTLLLGRFPPRVKLGMEILAGMAGIFLFILLTWGGIEQFWDSWIVKEVMPASVRLPYWLPKLALPLGALLMTIQIIIYIMCQLDILFSNRSKG